MYCDQCGKQIKDTAKVCGYCGSPQQPLEPREAPAEAPLAEEVEAPAAAEFEESSKAPAAEVPQAEPEPEPEPSPMPEVSTRAPVAEAAEQDPISPAAADPVAEPAAESLEAEAPEPQPAAASALERDKVEPRTSPAAAEASVGGRRGGRAWLWGLGGLIAAALLYGGYRLTSGSDLLPASAQVVPLHQSCSSVVRLQPDEPVVFQYGYWGVQGDEFIRANDQVLEIRLRVGNKTYQGERGELIGWDEIPCLDPDAERLAEVAGAQVLFDEVRIDGFKPGVYPIKVTMSLEQLVSDGFDQDGDGSLDLYGPGVISTVQKTLVVSE